MHKVWFTADTHFGHKNIIKYCNRPFLDERERQLAKSDQRGDCNLSDETVRRHDAGILDAINTRVDQQDTLWVLGDFCWGKLEQARHYRDRIQCRDVRLVWGSHDHRSVGEVFQQTIEQGMVRANGQKIWLNHYPMRTWDKSFHGSWHLYGHVHGALVGEDEQQNWRLAKDVGVDACDYRPIEMEELTEYMQPRLKAFEDRKQQQLIH